MGDPSLSAGIALDGVLALEVFDEELLVVEGTNAQKGHLLVARAERQPGPNQVAGELVSPCRDDGLAGGDGDGAILAKRDEGAGGLALLDRLPGADQLFGVDL